MRASVELRPVPESAGAARVFVERTLRDWGCTGLIDDARVVVTELVSNVVRHAGTDIRIDLELQDELVRVGVADRAGGSVVMRTPDPRLDLTGRGLRLVNALTERWGIDQGVDRKLVWAEWHA